MAQKRRILVAFEEDLVSSDQLQTQKRQRKFAVSGKQIADIQSYRSLMILQVSIEVTATNADLAREVASTIQQPIVTLEISGGFELRDQE
jgi:hypothetical protein